MQLFSTRESISVRRVSALAVLETIVSFIFILLLSKYDSSRYIFILAALAPLGLLRSSKSIATGLLYLDYYEKNRTLKSAIQILVHILFLAADFCSLYNRTYSKNASLLAFLLFSHYMGHLWVIRFLSTGYVLVSDPLKSISSMASNWRRIVFCEDLITPPSYLPGYHYGPRECADEIIGWVPQGIAGKIIHFGLYWMLLFQAFLFANIFRFSVKATCILFWPFLTFSKTASISSRSSALAFRSFRCSDLNRFRAGFSVIIILALIAKLSLYSSLTKIYEIKSKEDAERRALLASFESIGDLSMKIVDLKLFEEYSADDVAKSWANRKIQDLEISLNDLIYSDDSRGRVDLDESVEIQVWRWLGESPPKQLVRDYIILHEIPWWQVASALNAIIFLAMWCHAGTHAYPDRSLNLLGRTKPSGKLWITGCVFSLGFSLYVFECNLAILWSFDNTWGIVTTVWNSIGGWLPNTK